MLKILFEIIFEVPWSRQFFIPLWNMRWIPIQAHPQVEYALLMPIGIMNNLHSGFTWKQMVFMNYMGNFESSHMGVNWQKCPQERKLHSEETWIGKAQSVHLPLRVPLFLNAFYCVCAQPALVLGWWAANERPRVGWWWRAWVTKNSSLKWPKIQFLWDLPSVVIVKNSPCSVRNYVVVKTASLRVKECKQES